MNKCASTLLVILFSVWGVGLFSVDCQNMKNEEIEEVLLEMAEEISGSLGYWSFTIDSLPMYCVVDQANNRMRIFSPVSRIDNLKKGQLSAILEANFHSVLDVRYAISDDLIWVVFIHPMKELFAHQFRDAVRQVWNAVVTFGTTYSSTDLIFPKRDTTSGTKRM